MLRIVRVAQTNSDKICLVGRWPGLVQIGQDFAVIVSEIGQIRSDFGGRGPYYLFSNSIRNKMACIYAILAQNEMIFRISLYV